VLVALLAPLALRAQDDRPTMEEADPTKLNVPILRPDETFTDGFTPEHRGLLFAFNAAEGDLVNITLTPDDPKAIDPYLLLMGEAGEIYVSGAEAIEGFEVPATAGYFIYALDQSGSTEEAFFDLAISGNTLPDELAEDSLYYENAEVFYGETYNLDLTEELPIFYVKFTGAEQDAVTLFTMPPLDSSDPSATLVLFDYHGREIAAGSSDLSVTLPNDGFYLAFVTLTDLFDPKAVVETGQVQLTVAG
jgi:hypothetical protein